jgi:hypothetical protein
LIALPVLGAAAPRAAPAAASAARTELPGKPTGPIAVDHRLAAEPAVGVPVKITITARVESSVNGLTLEARASEPQAALVTAPEAMSAHGGVYTWELTVVPLVAAAGYLNVSVAGTIDGVAQARSIAISLRSAGAAHGVSPAAAGGGETLIALPVIESP